MGLVLRIVRYAQYYDLRPARPLLPFVFICKVQNVTIPSLKGLVGKRVAVLRRIPITRHCHSGHSTCTHWHCSASHTTPPFTDSDKLVIQHFL